MAGFPRPGRAFLPAISRRAVVRRRPVIGGASARSADGWSATARPV